MALLLTLATGHTVFAAGESLPAANALTDTGSAANIERSDGTESTDLPLNVSFVAITSPINEQTLIHPFEPISVAIKTGPKNGMPEGYTANLYMDGEIVSKGEGLELALPVPHRGSHTIKVTLTDSNGRVRARSQSITIFVQKHFIRKTQ